MRFNYTLNKEEIPTPYQGESYDPDHVRKIILSKELLGPNCDKAELKVIGFVEGRLPSLVAVKTYQLRADKPTIDLQEKAQHIVRPQFGA